MDIKGQAAIVTGGASGLGAATARALAAAGAKVAIVDVNEKAAHEIASELKGVAAIGHVADSASGEAAVKKAAAAHRPPRILVTCAGVGPAKRIVGRDGPLPIIESHSHQSDWHLQHDAVGRGHAGSGATRSGERGVIVSTASVAALRPDWTGSLLSSKAVSPRSRCLRHRLPIDCVLAIPPTFCTMLMHCPRKYRIPGASVPFPSASATTRIRRAVLHCIDNGYLNGEVIRLDGALRMAPR